MSPPFPSASGAIDAVRQLDNRRWMTMRESIPHIFRMNFAGRSNSVQNMRGSRREEIAVFAMRWPV
jgi:hypothetical protein